MTKALAYSSTPIVGKKHAKKYSELQDPVRLVIAQCGHNLQNRGWLTQLLEGVSIYYAVPRNQKTWVWISSNDLVPLEQELKKISSVYKPKVIG